MWELFKVTVIQKVLDSFLINLLAVKLSTLAKSQNKTACATTILLNYEDCITAKKS